MFSGIVEDRVKVWEANPRGEGLGLVLELGSLAQKVQVGDSIAVCGTCLTVEEMEEDRVSFYLSPETLSKTWLGRLKKGDRVNFEKALCLGEPVGGHLVQGHVDGIGKVVARIPEGEGETLEVEVPKELERYLLFKGSIAVDGISLTIAQVKGRIFSVAIIPLTIEKTNLEFKKPGDPVNLEADLIGKWVGQLIGRGGPACPPG